MKHLYILVITFLTVPAVAQLDNSSLFFNQADDTTHEREAYIKVQNLDYMKDNEYYGPIADGYTLFGVQLNPQLGYKLSKNLAVEAGVFLRKDFGNKNFDDVLPTFSLRYTKNDFRMVFGNLNGSLNHQLIEPLYNFENVITSRLENGAQFILNKRYFDFDVWIDWQNMIYKSGGGHEKIWGGLSSNLLKLKKGSSELKIPFQASLLHSGGQIDTSSSNSFSNWNYDAGLVFTHTVNKGHFQKWLLDARYVGRVNYLFTPAQIKTDGNGLLANAGFTAFNTDVMLSYWYGHNYISDLGGYLYSSQSSTVAYANTYLHERSLLILRITKKIKLADHAFLTLRAEPYYDLHLQRFEYSFGFYVSLDEQFWLKRK